MSVTYTTAALVKKQVHHIPSDLADADIEAMIIQAEGVIDGIMKRTGRIATVDFTFDADKHGLIRLATTSLACYLVLSYDVEYVSTAYASSTADLFLGLWKNCAEQLSDVRVVEYLKSL